MLELLGSLFVGAIMPILFFIYCILNWTGEIDNRLKRLEAKNRKGGK